MAALLLVALGISWRAGGEDAATILVPPDQRQAAPAASGPTVPVPPPATPIVSAEGLRLHGTTGSGAIIGYGGGRQRLVLIGREALPGLALREVRQQSVLLTSGETTVELGFSGPERLERAAVPNEPSRRREQRESEAHREERLQYRFGLEPQRSDGRITGYAIRRGAELPVLRQAGLQPGDVLISVNGQSFDSQEKVEELAREIAGSFTTVFEFERGGRRITRTLEVNPRT